jgi:hypothetical protein
MMSQMSSQISYIGLSRPWWIIHLASSDAAARDDADQPILDQGQMRFEHARVDR